MTDDDIKRDLALCEAATPGPWRPCASRTGVVADDDGWVVPVSRITPVLDVEFIAASRAGWPAALREVQRLRGEQEATRAAIVRACVDHVETNGHIDLAEQAADYLANDTHDATGKVQDFVSSLRVVIEQLDRQRRRANWYEAAYDAGKAKLIEHATAKLRADLVAMTAARDEVCEIAKRFVNGHGEPRTLPGERTVSARITDLRAVGKTTP